MENVSNFIDQVYREFQCCYLGYMTYFLGLEAHHCDGCFFVSRQKYLVELLKKFGLFDSKQLSTSKAPSSHLSKAHGEHFEDATTYWSLVDALQYLILSHPDIVHVISQVSKFIYCPTSDHKKAAKRTYIKGTLHLSLKFRPSTLIECRILVDLDWVGDPND